MAAIFDKILLKKSFPKHASQHQSAQIFYLFIYEERTDGKSTAVELQTLRALSCGARSLSWCHIGNRLCVLIKYSRIT